MTTFRRFLFASIILLILCMASSVAGQSAAAGRHQTMRIDLDAAPTQTGTKPVGVQPELSVRSTLERADLASALTPSRLARRLIRLRRVVWASAQISHYANGTDGYLGKRTACGKTTTLTSNFAAALNPRFAHCGERLTICYHKRCVHTTIQDSGGARSPGRYFDAANGLYHRLGFHGLATIHYTKDWH